MHLYYEGYAVNTVFGNNKVYFDNHTKYKETLWIKHRVYEY
jgi:hypothetical protein